MYEDQTYEAILQRSLDRVATDVDKREGSLTMNSIASVSAEHANIYILLDAITQNGYADTAIREYLIKRCGERGISPHEATHAVLKGKFNMEVPKGSRFTNNAVNYVSGDYIGLEKIDGVTYYYYQMTCETVGTEGNKYFSELTPITFIDKDLTGSLVELLIPAEDEEDTEDLRARYFSSLKSSAFGGNKQDYKEKTNSLDGVGGTVVVPVWNGGGSVKLIIIDSDYNKASDVLISKVQNTIDPTQDGSGMGLAPIGHIVTVVTAKEVPINVTTRITFNEGYSWDSVKHDVEQAIEDYLFSMRKAWEAGSLVVRVTQIENRLLNLTGVLDIADTTINGKVDTVVIANDEIPVFGGVTNG